MFKDLKLRYRLLLGFSVPVLLLIIMVLMVYFNLRSVNENSRRVEEARLVIYEAQNLDLSQVRMQRAVRTYILWKNETPKRIYEENSKLYEEHLGNLDKITKNEGQRDLLKKIAGSAKEIKELHDSLIPLVDAGQPEKAVRLFKIRNDVEKALALEQLMVKFEDREAKIIDEREAALRNTLAFTVWAVFLGAFLFIGLAIGSSLWITSSISQMLGEATSAVTSTSSQLASTVEQHERTASQQAAMVNETATTVDELGKSSKQSAEQAANAATVAQKASSLTEEGQIAVKQAVDAMNDLKNKINAVAEQILKLGEQTAQIGSIANLVKDIAGQTNMLALNAAVEAARAGEQGKGFAVVAGEVRKLADQSKRSAEQANVIIADIQKATNTTIMKTEEGSKRVEEVTHLAQKVGELFNTIAGSAGSVYENAQQVLLNTKQQSAALNQVVEAISNINAGAKETAAGLTQTKTSIETLNKTAQELKAII